MIIDSQQATDILSLDEHYRQLERERLACNIRQKQIGLRALFHYHGTTDDAVAAASQVEPNSIVMVEGQMTRRDYATKRLNQLSSLADRQVSSGEYKKELHMSGKAIALEFILREPPDEFSYTFYHQLFAKGCAVLPADYLNVSDTAAYVPVDSVPESPLVVDELLAGHFQWLGQQAFREQCAVDLSLVWMNQLAEVDLRPPIYIAYGLAHRHSLVKKFEALEITSEVLHSVRPGTNLAELQDLQLLTELDKTEVRQLLIMHHLGLAGLLDESRIDGTR